ncbi:MAG TPA: erythromycin esterase family protein [Phycisphaerales bacterium]|nr:erythromycin esterase family protein [Phycisphaerales bacterium]
MIRRSASAERSVAEAALVMEGVTGGLDPLIEAAGTAQAVLLGEGSHGTHEFYRCRAHITRRLIVEKGFAGVAVEADWPDAWRVNRFVRGLGDDPDADAALAGFERFPQWMWRNRDVREFVEWLRRHNDAQPPANRVGFYGVDLYSLHASMDAVLEYLAKVDAEAAHRARERYACFDRFGGDPQAYGYATTVGLSEGCEEEVVRQLVELRRSAAAYAGRDGRVAEGEQFFAEQNARLVKNAERYYRTMYAGGAASWNLRDTHMADTVEALIAYLGRARGTPVKLVVWAHNSHLGDARATEPAREGQINLGQLTRERLGAERTFIVGFTTHEGTVTAATDWGGPAERKRVRPSLPGSYERLFHETGLERFLLLLRPESDARRVLSAERLERAIGVIYRPQTERQSHYFTARLADQFDAVIHFDTTRAVWPLEHEGVWDPSELPETYPTGV